MSGNIHCIIHRKKHASHFRSRLRTVNTLSLCFFLEFHLFNCHSIPSLSFLDFSEKIYPSDVTSSSFMTYHRVCNQIIMTGATSGAGTDFPSGAPEFSPGVQWDSCYSIFSFMCMFCRSLFVLLSFLFWTLCCLFFFELFLMERK